METERLILRPFEETEEDLALILALYSDPEIMCYVPYDLLNGEQAKAHLKRIAEEWHREKAGNFEMAVILKDGGTPIGRAHFHLQEENDCAMIGCMLLKPWWGAGLAEEMVLAMIDHCFDELHLHRVIGLCHPDNIASWKMMERCGMRREAYCRKNVRYIKNGQERWEDELSYAILWEGRKRDKEDRKWKRQKLHSG
jgi:RimJ/RimL family protein N-acetyltransferase